VRGFQAFSLLHICDGFSAACEDRTIIRRPAMNANIGNRYFIIRPFVHNNASCRFCMISCVPQASNRQSVDLQ